MTERLDPPEARPELDAGQLEDEAFRALQEQHDMGEQCVECLRHITPLPEVNLGIKCWVCVHCGARWLAPDGRASMRMMLLR